MRSLPTLIVALGLVAVGRAAQFGLETIPPLHPVNGSGSKVFDRSAKVDVFAGWVANVLGHRPAAVDDAVVATAHVAPATLDDLRTEIVPLVALMARPQATAFSMPNDGKSVPQSLLYNAQALERLRAAARSVNVRSTNPDDFFALAAILHTDVAFHPDTLRRASTTAAGPSRAVIQFGDGAQVGLNETADHVNFARRLLRLIPHGTTRDADILRWFQATMAWQQSDQFWDVTHADTAIEWFPDAPELLVLDGSLHEVLASPAVHAVVDTATLPHGTRLDVASARDELRKAATVLKRAVDLTPNSIDARVRYGRVLSGLSRWNEAVAVLRGLPELAPDARSKYYAALFLGDACEGAGQLQEARTAYLEAARLFPFAQSPRLALSHLAWASGDRSAALDALAPSLTARRSDDDDASDPLWTYSTWQGRDAGMWLADAYARLSRPGPLVPR